MLLAVNLPGMHLVDPPADHFDGQVIYLDFDGAKDVTYHGPVTVGPFDVPAYEAPAGMKGQEQAVEADVLKDVQATFSGSGLRFTLIRPEAGSEYSTVYVGGDGSAFRSYGRFDGLAEDVDAGNSNHTDSAFVFSAGLGDASQVSAIVAHETGHLVGYTHDLIPADIGILEQVAYSSGDRVKCTQDAVNVRMSPSTTASTLGQVNTNDQGTIQSGPYSGSGYTWYYIKWDKFSQAGYTAQDYLAAVAVTPLPAPTLSAPSDGATGVSTSPTFTWSQVTGNQGYRIIISTNSADMTTSPTSTGGTSSGAVTYLNLATNTTSYTYLNTLAAGTLYYWEVHALGTSSANNGYWSQASFTTAAASGVTNDYPTDLATAPKDSVVDPYGPDAGYGFYNRECTSYVAWRMNRDHGTTSAPYYFTNYMVGPNGKPGHWSDASSWVANAQLIGFSVDHTPAVGAIAWFSYGHVAYVESVNGDGTVNVSEYNYYIKTSPGTWSQRSDLSPDWFIHINDAPPQYADLIPQNIVLNPTSGLAGSTTQVTFSVVNSGAGASLATTANIRLSTSSSAPSTSDPLLGTVSINAMSSGGSQSFSPTYTIPAGTSAGQYYVWVIVDPNNNANQGSSTGNDRVSSAYTVNPTVNNPTITSVSPSLPVATGESSNVAIIGTGFSTQATVTLHDLTNNVDYPARPIVSRNDTTQITIAPNFGNVPANWSVEVINPGGLSSGQFHLSVAAPTLSDTVAGVDVSHYQGTINWAQVQSGGNVFAFAKATEGAGGADDATFTANMQGGKAAGLLMGAYDFARPDLGDAITEADHFVSVVQSYLTAGYLRPVLDVETGGSSTLATWVQQWMNEVQSKTGLQGIIYTTSSYASTYMASLTSYPLWIADPTHNPPMVSPWGSWNFWQLGSTTVSGISGPVDVDVFNGNVALLQSFVISASTATPTITITSPLTFSEDSPFSIDGCVKDSNGVGIAGLQIGADDWIRQQCLLNIATTDSQGNFQISYSAGIAPAVYPLTLYVPGATPRTLVFSVLPASTSGLYTANSLQLNMGLMSGVLTDPFTLSVAPKIGILSPSTTQQLMDAATSIGQFGLSWLDTYASQFFTDWRNDVAVAGLLTCPAFETGVGAVVCAASVDYVENSLIHTGAVSFADTAVDQWVGNQAAKDELHKLIEAGDLLWSAATLDKNAGLIDLADLGYSIAQTAIDITRNSGGAITKFVITAGSSDGSEATAVSCVVPNPVTPTRIISLGGNLTFGNVMVGSSLQGTLTIYNNGNSTLTVSDISYPSGFTGSWSGTIAAGGSQPVTVTFSPTSATTYSGTVTVSSDETNSGGNTINALGTGTQATSLPTISIVATQSNGYEFGGVPATVRFTRTGDTSGQLSVAAELQGTAVNGVDYANMGSIVIPAGSGYVDVQIVPLDQHIVGGSKTVILQINTSLWYTAGSPSSATVTIFDNDPANSAPNAPVNATPADGATDVALTATLQASAFSDPDAGDTQAASQWHVMRSSDSTIVYDSGEDTVNKSSITIPAIALAGSTAYTWQVRYEDDNGAWSQYSAATGFTTVHVHVLLQDDFADPSLNPLNWISYRASGVAAGSSVTVAGGAVTIAQDLTDNGGFLESLPLTFAPTGLITIRDRVYVHANGGYVYGGTALRNTANWNWQFGVAHVSVPGCNAFNFGDNGWATSSGYTGYGGGSNFGQTSSIWDGWFDETITLDPATSVVTYSVNGGPAISGTLSAPMPQQPLTLVYNSYGWGTGSYEKIDSVSVTQVDVVAPTVARVRINDGNVQRSMVNAIAVTFSEPVALTGNPLQVVRRNGSPVAGLTVSAAVNPSGDQETWELTFAGSAVVNGSLPDGGYKLVVAAAGVADLAGNPLMGDYSQKFFRLFGDYDGNRVVDRNDLIALRQAINQPATAASWFDYDGNGTIDRSDLLQFRARLRRQLL